MSFDARGVAVITCLLGSLRDLWRQRAAIPHHHRVAICIVCHAPWARCSVSGRGRSARIAAIKQLIQGAGFRRGSNPEILTTSKRDFHSRSRHCRSCACHKRTHACNK
jgi:hypothetical protein